MMTLISVQCLPIAPGSAQSLPFKLGLTLWSGCLRRTSSRSIWTALSRFSNSPQSRIQQYCSVQSPRRPRHLHRNPQPFIAVRITALLPQIPFHGIRSLHSEIPGKGSEDVTQRLDGIAGDKLSALVSFPFPMPNRIQINLEGNKAATSSVSNEPATKPKSASPNVSSKDSTKSTRPDELSSAEHPVLDVILFLSLLIVCCGLPFFAYLKGREHGAQDLTAQPPDCEIFTERESLRKKQEKLRSMDECIVHQNHDGRQKQAKGLAEEAETLGRKELDHLRQRAMVLKKKLKTQNASIETVNARKRLYEAVIAGILLDKTYAREVGDVCLETLSADNDAAKDEIGQLRRVKEALQSRLKVLEVEAMDRMKRLQELNAPKSEPISSVGSKMLLGSALAFGATMIMSVVGN